MTYFIAVIFKQFFGILFFKSSNTNQIISLQKYYNVFMFISLDEINHVSCLLLNLHFILHSLNF